MRKGHGWLGLCGLALVITVGLVGCGKEPEGTAKEPEGPVVSLIGSDINADGTISASGLKKLDAEAGKDNVHVVFVRSQVTDAGLMQLAKYPKIKMVSVGGGKVTPAGIDKLKKALPKVEVQ